MEKDTAIVHQKRRMLAPFAALALVALIGSGAVGSGVEAVSTPLPGRVPYTPPTAGGDTVMTINDMASAVQVRDAIVDDLLTQSLVAGQSASFIVSPSLQHGFRGVSDDTITTFPMTSNTTFGLLSTGNVSFTLLPNNSPATSANNGFVTNDRGPSDFDTVILAINFLDPPRLATDNDQTWCLSIDFRFLSEEYPEWVGTAYNDAFVAELDQTTWLTVGALLNPIVAPHNFAFTPDAVAINTLVNGMSAAAASGTTYDGATVHYRAYTYIPNPGSATTHVVYFSVFDQGDAIYDSTVFLDGLRVFRGAPNDPCTPGTASTIAP